MATPVDILIRARDEFSAVTNKAQAEINALAKSNVELGNATVRVSQQSTQAANGLNKIAEGAQHSHRSFIEANESARALGEQIGVTLPRYVSSFLARTSTIGPILESAFSGLAVIGLIQVIGELPEAFKKVEGAITGWSEKEQKAYEKFIEDNKKAVERVHELAVELEKITAGPAASTKLDLSQKLSDLGDLSRRAAALRTQADELIRQSGTGKFRNAEGLTAGELVQKAEVLEGEANDLAEVIRKLQNTVTTQAAEANVEAAREFEKLNNQAREMAAEQRKFWKGALVDFEIRSGTTGGAGGDVAAGFAENERLAKLYIKDWEDIKKLEQEGGDQLLKNQEAWNKLLEDFRSKGPGDDVKAGEAAADRTAKAIINSFDEAKKRGEEIIKGISDDIGRMFTDSIVHGQNFWKAFQRLGLDAIAAVTNALVKGFLTKGLTSLLGAINPGGGLGKLLGLGGSILGGAGMAAAAPAASAFTSIGGTTLLNTGFAASSIVPAPAGAGLSGLLGLGGGAGLLGLGSATIPVLGTAIALGIFGLSKLFGHHTQESPFTRDPNVSQERTYFFYAANELADAARDLSGATKQLKGINPNDVVVKGLPSALQQSNQFRRGINGVLQDDI